MGLTENKCNPHKTVDLSLPDDVFLEIMTSLVLLKDLIFCQAEETGEADLH